MNNNKKKRSRWVKWRHKPIRDLLNLVFTPYVRKKYGVTIEPFRGQPRRQYLILFNHQTAYDQFFVGAAFDCPVYYVASEDLFSNGISSALIKYLVAPIPIKKQATDPRAVINCIKVAKEGGTIALAPEGNRTFTGRSVHINPAIASLARHLGLPIAFFRIEGGYGVHPRWSDAVRGGNMKAGVSRVMEQEEYLSLTDEELCETIRKELYTDESLPDREYPCERQAEYLERAIYLCPVCGLSKFESSGDLISCKRCSLTVRHKPTKELCGVGTSFPYSSVAEWYDAQESYVNSLDPRALGNEPLECDNVRVFEVIPYKKKRIVYKNAELRLYKDRFTVSHEGDILELPFDSISVVAVLGKNKLNVYSGKQVYQLKGGARLCALKYVNLFYRYKNVTKGDLNAKFLGL